VGAGHSGMRLVERFGVGKLGRRGRMANGEWRMANGEWRMANGEWRNRAYASDDAIKVDFMIKVKERAIGMGNRSRT